MSAAGGIVRSKMVEAQVLSNTSLTERLYSLRLGFESVPFKAGQFVRLQMNIDGEPVAKSYSLVNAPGDLENTGTEIFFNTVPGGRLSNALAALKVGDALEVSQPANGFFVLEEAPESRDLWLIATGTGLGPYLSMLRTEQIWEQYQNIVLVHGVPLVEELVYQDIIEQAKATYPQRFRYISCVSREKNPQGFEGRVTDALDGGYLEQNTGLVISTDHSTVMLCGNHHMINEIKVLLAERGMRKHLRHKPGQIITEQYF